MVPDKVSAIRLVSITLKLSSAFSARLAAFAQQAPQLGRQSSTGDSGT